MLDRFLFFFNDTATTEIYTLSLHDALPISQDLMTYAAVPNRRNLMGQMLGPSWRHFGFIGLTERYADCLPALSDRKSTRLNSSHANISYAVFCLKKKKKQTSIKKYLRCVYL